MKFERIFIILSFIAIYVVQSYGAEKKVSLTSAEYPPYYGEKLKNNGPVTEIVTEAFSKVGYKVTVNFLPWIRGEQAARIGAYDGMFPPWHTKERENYFVFSNPLFPNEIGFFKRRGTKITYKNYYDLKGYRIGIVRGYANPKGFNNAGLNVEEVSIDRLNLVKLAKGRIDLALIDRKLAQYIIATEMPEYSDALEWIDPPLELKMQFVCISKKTKNYGKILKDFNKGLEQLKNSGEFQKILLKHGF